MDRGAWLCVLLGLLGCTTTPHASSVSREDRLRPDREPTPAGYTKLIPAMDSRFIYVSSSRGNDKNSGFSSTDPVASVERGVELLRDGKPDWLLFRRGDSFKGSLGQWLKQGRSSEEPMVVWSYGKSKKRPLFRTLEDDGFGTSGDSNSPLVISHVVFMGLHFYASLRDPGAPGFRRDVETQGVLWLRGTRDVLIEDCVFSYYALGVSFEDFDKGGISNVRLRRNLFLDQWHEEKAQGVYLDGVHGALIEGNVFDHTGANPRAGAEPTIFSHNVYIQSNCGNVSVRDNILMRATSHGLQLRPGGSASGNLFVRNSISLLLGGSEPKGGTIEAAAVDNVILEGTNISADEPRGWGIDVENVRRGKVSGNIVAHLAEPSENAMAIDTDKHTRFMDNIVYDWPPGKDSPGPFVDPNRSVAGYNAAQGGPKTFEGFIEAVRKTSRLEPNPKYSAPAVNAWIRQGFARP